MKWEPGDRVVVNNPVYELHHGVHGTVKEQMPQSHWNAGQYSVVPDNNLLNDNEYCDLFFIDSQYLEAENDNNDIVAALSGKAKILRESAQALFVELAAAKAERIEKSNRAWSMIEEADALEKAARVLDRPANT